MSGPYCTMLLADAGAEVIKIERPGRGDPRRSIPPFVEAGGVKKAGGYLAYNRNKKSLALNLRDPAGQKILRELAAVSDVVVDNLRPGVTAKLGLDYASLRAVNDRLVYAAISGFGGLEGYSSDYSKRPAFDIVAEAMSGVMNLVGFADKTRREVVDTLNAAGVPTGPVYTAKDVFEDEHFRRRGSLVEIEDSEVGPTTFARTVPHLSAAPEIRLDPAPGLGEHSRPILEDLLGYESGKVDALVESGVVAE